MGQFTTVRRSTEKGLAPVTLTGILVPSKALANGRVSNYKLICSSGLEYAILPEPEWRGVLSWYSWEEVRIIGLLDVETLTLIPKRVFPKGPKGEKENVIDLLAWKGREVVKKFKTGITDLVVIPAAVF